MNLSRVLELMPSLGNELVPQGIVDEGRIFALGSFSSANLDHARVVNVLEGLKDQVLQPFGLHPWAFVLDYSTYEVDGVGKPLSILEVVKPQSDGSIVVNQYLLMPKRVPLVAQLVFQHTETGTQITVTKSETGAHDVEELAAMSNYPLAVAILNTRGCRIDLKRTPSIKNAKRKKIGKAPIPAHYNADAKEYLTALNSSRRGMDRGSAGKRASPIPHIRRAHERVYSDGTRIIVPPTLVNVRSENDISFVELRKAYPRVT